MAETVTSTEQSEAEASPTSPHMRQRIAHWRSVAVFGNPTETTAALSDACDALEWLRDNLDTLVREYTHWERQRANAAEAKLDAFYASTGLAASGGGS